MRALWGQLGMKNEDGTSSGTGGTSCVDGKTSCGTGGASCGGARIILVQVGLPAPCVGGWASLGRGVASCGGGGTSFRKGGRSSDFLLLHGAVGGPG